jgi:site-specific DNA-methyltransferase (adenine-specific)
MICEIIEGDCLAVMRGMADNSFDAIVTDPPYFKVKGEAWDRQWEKPTQFLAWIGDLCEQWQRLLKPNGSLYCFASSRMAARVECKIAERFHVLNRICWAKGGGNAKSGGWWAQQSKETMRTFFPESEYIVFSEHYGADNIAKGEAGYVAKCDELRGFVFEPLRAYIAGEWQRAGLTARDANAATGTQMAGHYLTQTQWALPTEANYEKLRHYANRNGGEYLRREYEDLRREYEDLRREYEDLRREYEDLRRPFSVTAEVPYTDVWTFPTVQHYKGKHPCEKPLAMMEHIVRASTRPGAAVLDCFAGSGSTGVACRRLGRDFVGIELDADYAKSARARIASATGERPAPPEKRPEPPPLDNLPLFRNLGPAA